MTDTHLFSVLGSGWFLLCMAVTLAVATVGAEPSHAAAKSAATALRTGYLENPLGIDSLHPKLSWQFTEGGRGGMQSAYQVQVASAQSLLESGKPDVWDSGKVTSDACTGVQVEGLRLASGMRYWWHVKVWDGDAAAGGWSQPAFFEMGLLHPGDWQGQWITSPPAAGNGYQSARGDTPDSVKWVQVDLGQPETFHEVKLFPTRPYNLSEDIKGYGFPRRYRVEASDDAGFATSTMLADRTGDDQQIPDGPVTLQFPSVTARYVRLTATKLYTRVDWVHLIALAEVQVLSANDEDLAHGKPVQALDSVEDHTWGERLLTAGIAESLAATHVAPMFRHEFTLDKPVARGRVYVCGLGYCDLHLNGRKVGDRVLDPAYTNFGKRSLYSTYDVTKTLHEGPNAIAAILGKGWYEQSPRMIVQLNIDFTDGTHKSVTTGPDWKLGKSPILDNSIYNGETYDARLEQPGWDEPGFNESTWQSADVVPSPTKQLSAEMMQPIRVTQTLLPVSIKSPKPGVWVYDFGQNFSGWCRLKVQGPAGTEITLRHAEVLYPDGTVNQENLRSAKATDTYIMKGHGTEVYQPHFTYHGFRYVQMTGYLGDPVGKDVLEGELVRTSVPAHGTFECSNPLINQIQHNSFWGYQTNFHSIPTDCPQRDERQGWMGDAGMTVDMGFYNFDMSAAYSNFLQDIQDAQGADGRIPDTVPHIWGTESGDPMWSAAYHFIVWTMYRHTGDKAILERHYDGLKRYVDMLHKEAPDYILTRSNYGDWVGLVETPKDLISTGSFYLVSKIVSDMAEVLGKTEDQKTYSDLCAHIAEAFNKRFFDPKTNVYGNGSQFSYIWPLYLDIVPPDHNKAVVDNLVHDIMVTHNGHLTTGFIGTRYLFETLCKEGRPDVAYTVVTQKDYPGYGYMIAHGATTIWELWQDETGGGMNSHNHPAFGFVSGWFYSDIAGIVPEWKHAGYERFDIKPYLMGDLKEAKASVETVRGLVASHWVRDDKGVTLEVTIPADSQADVWVPKGGIKDPQISDSGKPLWGDGHYYLGDPGLQSGEDAGEWVRFRCGSGTYSFQVTAG